MPARRRQWTAQRQLEVSRQPVGSSHGILQTHFCQPEGTARPCPFWCRTVARSWHIHGHRPFALESSEDARNRALVVLPVGFSQRVPSTESGLSSGIHRNIQFAPGSSYRMTNAAGSGG